MKYYELQKKMMSWEKGEVFKEDEIPDRLLFGHLFARGTVYIHNSGPNVDDQVWKEISEEKYEKLRSQYYIDDDGGHVFPQSSIKLGKKEPQEDIDMEEIEEEAEATMADGPYPEDYPDIKSFLILKELHRRITDGGSYTILANKSGSFVIDHRRRFEGSTFYFETEAQAQRFIDLGESWLRIFYGITT